MSYLLPYDSVYSLWLMAAPIYEWEPLAPAEGESGQQSSPDVLAASAAAGADSVTPEDACPALPMQWVFKGLQLSAVPGWTLRENPYYEMLRQDQQDDNEARRLARKAAVPPAAASTATPAEGD